jgi:hypothetical protein
LGVESGAVGVHYSSTWLQQRRGEIASPAILDAADHPDLLRSVVVLGPLVLREEALGLHAGGLELGKTAINPTEGTFQSCATCAEEFARARRAGEDPFEAIGKLRGQPGPSSWLDQP